MRVLYVEDNRINALLFEEALKLAEGFELRIAEDGAQALDIARDWTPDVLVIDAHLPDTTGLELLPRLRSLPGLATTPAYVCSADTLPEDESAAREGGFDGYWAKPIDIPRLLSDLATLRR